MESGKYESLQSLLKLTATDLGIDLTNPANRLTLWAGTSSQGPVHLGSATASGIEHLIGKSPILQDTIIYDAELNQVILRNCEAG